MPYLYEMTVTLLTDLCLIGIGVGGYFLWRISGWARPKRLMRLSQQLNLVFTPQSVRLNRKLPNAFPLTSTGSDPRLYNVICGHYRDTEVHLFDYEFMADERRYRQTVYAFELRRSGVCRFASCPADKVASNPLQYWKGVKIIPVGTTEKARKIFAARHKLVGLNEFGTCLQFNRKAVSYFSRHTDIWTEAGGKWLLVYQLDRVTPIGQMPRELWKAYQICRVLQLNNNRVPLDDLDENDSSETPDKDSQLMQAS